MKKVGNWERKAASCTTTQDVWEKLVSRLLHPSLSSLKVKWGMEGGGGGGGNWGIRGWQDLIQLGGGGRNVQTNGCLRPLFFFGRVWENGVWSSFFSDINKDGCAKMAFWNLGFLGYVNLWKSIFLCTKDVSSLLFCPRKMCFLLSLFQSCESEAHELFFRTLLL